MARQSSCIAWAPASFLRKHAKSHFRFSRKHPVCEYFVPKVDNISDCCRAAHYLGVISNGIRPLARWGQGGLGDRISCELRAHAAAGWKQPARTMPRHLQPLISLTSIGNADKAFTPSERGFPCLSVSKKSVACFFGLSRWWLQFYSGDTFDSGIYVYWPSEGGPSWLIRLWRARLSSGGTRNRKEDFLIREL